MSDDRGSGIPAALDEAIGFNLYRVALLFRRELMVALADFALTPEQWQVLVALWSTAGDVNQQDLCALTLKDRHAMSRMLARMERDGWVKRKPDPHDLRGTLVRPTQKANRHREKIPKRLYAHFDATLRALSPDEAQQLLSHLKKLRDHMEPRGSTS